MSDAYSVSYSPESMDDLREIYAYIAFTLLVPEAAKKTGKPHPERGSFS